MIFQLDSLNTLQTFQNQSLRVQLSELIHGTWNPDLSTRLFDNVHISVIQKESNSIFVSTRLKSSHFIVGSSFLNDPPSEKGGTVLFPLRDILHVWIRALHLPETLAPQAFLESIFQKNYCLHIVLTFAPVYSFYYSKIPLAVQPTVQYFVEKQRDTLPLGEFVNTWNGPG